MDESKEILKEELKNKIYDALLDNYVFDSNCFKLSEHKEFIDKIIYNIEHIENYDYRNDFDNYIKNYINASKSKDIAEIKTAIQDFEIKTEYGNVSNINQSKIKSNKNKLQLRKNIFALTLATTMYFTGIGVGKSMSRTIDNTHTVNLNPNKIVATIKTDVNAGDTLSSIVDKYYNEDYENVYGSKDNFMNSIVNQNQINPDKLAVGQILMIPVVIDKDNPYFQEIISLTTKIKELEQNEKWIKYTVRLDDNLSILAGWGSGSYSVSREEENEIYNHNKLSSKTLYPGQELEIINPKIGNLKIELRKAQREFQESLINNQKTK